MHKEQMVSSASSEGRELVIRRILVALDASSNSLAALEAAVQLAEELEAELMGIFVEDVNLLRVAQLPFVREVRFPNAQAHPIDLALMEKFWREMAAEIRRQLSELAERSSLSWTFEVARGAVAKELLTKATSYDLLALGRTGRSFWQGARLGSTARSAADRPVRPVLLMRAGVNLNLPVLVVFDGSEAANRAIRVAATLSKKGGQLRVLVWADSFELASQYKKEIIELLQEQELEISYRRFYPEEPQDLSVTLRDSEVGLVVISSGGSETAKNLLRDVLEDLDLPLLIVP